MRDYHAGLCSILKRSQPLLVSTWEEEHSIVIMVQLTWVIGLGQQDTTFAPRRSSRLRDQIFDIHQPQWLNYHQIKMTTYLRMPWNHFQRGYMIVGLRVFLIANSHPFFFEKCLVACTNQWAAAKGAYIGETFTRIIPPLILLLSLINLLAFYLQMVLL